jgi:ferredoxin
MGDVPVTNDQQALHPAILLTVHTITLSPGGQTFQVESHESVLTAALRSGLVIPYGC